jgi:Zn-dependent protease with chaperone function
MHMHAELIARMERLARSRPRLFRLRAIATLALGYLGTAGLAGAPAVAAAVGLLAIARAEPVLPKALGALLLVLALVACVRDDVARNLPGERVDAVQAAELLALLARLRARLQLRYPREVRITPLFDAALYQDSNRGVFGGGARRSVLLLGLPLLKCLNEAQLEAVMAHELGHLAGAHAAQTSRARHLGNSLRRMHAALAHEKGRVLRMLWRMLEWYLPQLEACTLPLARANEADADRMAVRATSPAAFAQALVAHWVVGLFWRRHYWRWVAHYRRCFKPQALFPYSAFGLYAFQSVPEQERLYWLEAGLQQQPAPMDSHAGLRERLAAIGARAELALPEAGATADRLLRGERERLDALFDRRWREGTVAAQRLLHELPGRHRSAS